MTLPTIQQEWEGFAAAVFTGWEPSPVQVEEMRRAFFAGASAMIATAKRIGEPDISEEEGVAYLEARFAECQEFYRKLLADHARKN